MKATTKLISLFPAIYTKEMLKLGFHLARIIIAVTLPFPQLNVTKAG